MTFARPDPISDLDILPRMPAWVTSARAETLEDVAFLSGAALNHLHLVLEREEVPQALLRDRLALRAAGACVAFTGRSEREAELRDAVAFLQPGDSPGPAGEVYLAWQQAVKRPISVKAVHRAFPDLEPELIAVWLDAGQGTPVPRAASVLQAVLADRPRGLVAAVILVDAAFAQALGWCHVLPLLALGLKRADMRKSGEEPALGPDAKSQLSVLYRDGKPVGVSSVVLSTQHLDPDLTSDDIRAIVEPYITEVLPDGWLSGDTVWHVNPTGKFVIGGPDGDAGLTGRKIIVDTYGGAAPHGGGAFSGKDPTKVDRSAAYAGRYLAKNVVAAGLADKCTIQLAYAIGVSKPLSVYIDTYGTGKVDEDAIAAKLCELVDLSPRGIREHLELSRPVYARTAAYGHFGRAPDADGGFSWERTDIADALKSAF